MCTVNYHQYSYVPSGGQKIINYKKTIAQNYTFIHENTMYSDLPDLRGIANFDHICNVHCTVYSVPVHCICI